MDQAPQSMSDEEACMPFMIVPSAIVEGKEGL